ncbi:MAG: GNAT family N-acetyltransferase [Rhizobiaceae bacterium]|nr:GNAT family N-acetyltransferase [Rhizobiaceae bacterium]
MDLYRMAGAGAAAGLRPFYPLGAIVKGFVPAPVRRMRGRFDPGAEVLGRLGSLEVRLARSREEVKAAQQLRYHVFYEEMSARPSRVQKLTRRDKDGFDRYCDHLLVIDRTRGGPLGDQIVGTYRLMGEEGAALAGGFYTAQEFDIAPLLARHRGKRFLELGRSCVLKDYRGKRTVELLWQGIYAYVRQNRIDVLFGCASLSGTDPATLALPLSFLKTSAAAPAEWRVRAQPRRGIAIDETIICSDPRRALAALPPLLKGYLRIGGYIGEDAVVDHQFGTTDVLVVVPVVNINPRYIEYYGDTSGRFAA